MTYLRVKYVESDNRIVVKGEGKDMLTRRIYALETVITRSEDNLSKRGHVRTNQIKRDRRNDNTKQK